MTVEKHYYNTKYWQQDIPDFTFWLERSHDGRWMSEWLDNTMTSPSPTSDMRPIPLNWHIERCGAPNRTHMEHQ